MFNFTLIFAIFLFVITITTIKLFYYLVFLFLNISVTPLKTLVNYIDCQLALE